MTSDPMGEPWSDTTYRGFAGAEPPPPRRMRLPRIGRRELMIGAGAAVALGLAFGFLLRPNLATTHDTDAAERAAPAVPVEVNRPPPPAPLRSDGKLEVLSPDMAAAARMPAASGSFASAAVAAPVMPSLAPPPPAPAEVQNGPTVIRGIPSGPPPVAARSRAGADCASAAGLADQMICGDPEVAAADREMNRAYRRALQAVARPGALRADQRDWLAIREDAAHHSRRALAQVYQQRIDELNAAAEDRDGAQEAPEF
ncbi:lysozyme inhibitor LprI family protein [Phenylobacterium soli]|uniref:Lysozyme inhibitor LprI-like N-terminal domain-containing protein n=1 Tax=Phenylobacterium soli TaxID=2170551 RepID=A0A328AGT7_9CAUL|nr:lysozyme inhibitor LprI family protein [Phenylobacterium soli]RAK53715.1 hypothetical protein DJ017_03820 [Phenylobacterium soli]